MLRASCLPFSLLAVALLVCASVSLAQETAQESVRESPDETFGHIYRDLAETENIETEFYSRFVEQGALRSEDQFENLDEEDEGIENEESLVFWVTVALIAIILIGFSILIVQNAGLLRNDMQERAEARRQQTKKRQAPDATVIQARADAYAKRRDRFAAVEDMLAEAFTRGGNRAGFDIWGAIQPVNYPGDCVPFGIIIKA